MKFFVTFRWRAEYDPVDAGTAQLLHWFAARLDKPDDLRRFVCAVLGADWKAAKKVADGALLSVCERNAWENTDALDNLLSGLARDYPDAGRKYHYVVCQGSEIVYVITRPWSGLRLDGPFWRSLHRVARRLAPDAFWRISGCMYSGDFASALTNVRALLTSASRSRRTYEVELLRDLKRHIEQYRDKTADVLAVMEATFDCLVMERAFDYLGLGGLNGTNDKQEEKTT